MKQSNNYWELFCQTKGIPWIMHFLPWKAYTKSLIKLLLPFTLMVINQFTPFNLAVNLFGLIYEHKAEHFISSGTFFIGCTQAKSPQEKLNNGKCECGQCKRTKWIQEQVTPPTSFSECFLIWWNSAVYLIFSNLLQTLSQNLTACCFYAMWKH